MSDVESTHKTRIPAEAFGGTVPDDDALRFYRLIEERSYLGNGVEAVELACGHTVSYDPPLPEKQEYGFCFKCKERMGCK